MYCYPQAQCMRTLSNRPAQFHLTEVASLFQTTRVFGIGYPGRGQIHFHLFRSQYPALSFWRNPPKCRGCLKKMAGYVRSHLKKNWLFVNSLKIVLVLFRCVHRWYASLLLCRYSQSTAIKHTTFRRNFFSYFLLTSCWICSYLILILLYYVISTGYSPVIAFYF